MSDYFVTAGANGNAAAVAAAEDASVDSDADSDDDDDEDDEEDINAEAAVAAALDVRHTFALLVNAGAVHAVLKPTTHDVMSPATVQSWAYICVPATTQTCLVKSVKCVLRMPHLIWAKFPS